MPKAAILVISLLAAGLLHAQKDNHLEVCFGIGPSWLVKGKTPDSRIGRSEFGGVTYCLQNKKKPMAFTPGIYYLRNLLNTHVNQMSDVRVEQYALVIRPAVRLRVGKHLALRVGMNFLYLFHSEVYQAHKDVNNSRTLYYSSDFSEGYFSQRSQAGLQVGIGLPFRIYRRMFSFNVEAMYYASRLVRYDFVKEVLPRQETQVLYTTSRPLALLLGFDIDMRRLKKKKTAEEE